MQPDQDVQRMYATLGSKTAPLLLERARTTPVVAAIRSAARWSLGHYEQRSEVPRAGLHALRQLPSEEPKRMLLALEEDKTGGPAR
jgi:xanthine dehydrogenase iron-sulfur cluster and FAD-binding subunit A